MIEDDSRELQIEVTSSTNTSTLTSLTNASTLTSLSQPLKKKKEFFVKIGYPSMNTRRGYRK
jgi:hypothetical protein